MLSRLNRLVEDLCDLPSKLILLVGAPHVGKTALLKAFGDRVDVTLLNIGAELGRCLAAVPQRQRHLRMSALLQALADEHARGDLLLVDNIELLFDPQLKLDPIDILKRQARVRRVIAVWPGTLTNHRLTYADFGHPEQRDYGTDGLIAFELK